MIKKLFTSVLLLSLFLNVSCEKSEGSRIEPTLNDDINYFIWKGMNAYYLWQEDVPTLSDTRFSTFDELYTHFRGFSSPESVFESLRYQPGSVDRFSWIVDDYIALENSFLGINVTNGMEFGLVPYKNNPSNYFGYVRYVVPNSDAAAKNVVRGMIFNTVNGIQITEMNFGNLLFDDSMSYVIGLADHNDGNPVTNGNSISLVKSEIQENPIASTKILSEGNKKIGYLMYNGFSRNYDGDLNAVFANFQSENIDDLIIDLRYNPGGSTMTATYLGSMITGQFNNQLYSQEVWNQKVMNAVPADRFQNNFTDRIRNLDQNGNLVIDESINSLGLNRVYFITKSSTASASELVINSLSSYIDVHLIGTTTRGKQVGSVTLYDSDNLTRSGDNLNTSHRYAMQPLVFEISNKDNVNHPDGLRPGLTLPGIELGEDFGNLGELGSKSDPLLDRTITYILTGAKPSMYKNATDFVEDVFDSKLATPTGDNMYSNNRKFIQLK